MSSLVIARGPIKEEPATEKVSGFHPAKWWTDLTEEKQEYYLRGHPASKYHKMASAALKERLAKNPKERKTLRARIKALVKNPMKFLHKDFDKIAAGPDKLTEDQKKEMVTAIDESKKNPHKILKAVMIGLAAAGALTLAGGLIASGGLPYVIIAGRLIGDARHVYKDVHDRLTKGDHPISAVFSSITERISAAMHDPKMIAAALMISLHKKKKGEEEQEKPDEDKKEKPAKDGKKPKVQKAAPKQPKKDKPAAEKKVKKEKENVKA